MNDLVMQLVDSDRAERLRCGEVVNITESGTVIASFDGDGAPRPCELLVTTESTPPILVPGDRVLIWSAANSGLAVVLGRIGPTLGAAPEPATPDTLTIEAKQSLTLRVGEGSITLREDGRILIRGKDLVSHAQRMNRIKGGAVSIN